MSGFFDFFLDFIAQFVGGRGDIHNELVHFGLPTLFWGGLLAVALYKYKEDPRPRERLLRWGFGFAFLRSLFMLTVFSFHIAGVIELGVMHVFFPPLEHFLAQTAVVIIAGAFLLYFRNDEMLAGRYLLVGLGATFLCYLASFWWWAYYITANPLSKFGQTWCDWLFHVTASLLLLFPVILLARSRARLKNIVVIALGFFFLDDFLKIIDIASHEAHEAAFAPIRHSLHLLAIFLLGYVYFKEQSFKIAQSLEEVRQSKAQCRRVIETANDAIFLADADTGVILDVNEQAGRLLGLPPDKLVGMRQSEIYPEEEVGRYTESIKTAVQQGKPFFCTMHVRHADGRLVPVEISANVVELDGTKVILGIFRDITERKRAEEIFAKAHSDLEERIRVRTAELVTANSKLKQQVEDRKRMELAVKRAYDEFYQIFNTASDAIQVVDKNYNIIRVNEAFSALAGVERQEAVGRKCYEVFGGDACHTQGCALARILEGEERLEFESERKGQDGTRLPCITAATPFRQFDGELTGIVLASKDITAWKKAEETLRAFAADLERSNQDLQDFAHTVSHDLKEPLMLIQAFGERLKKKCGDLLPPNGNEYLKRIGSAAGRMQGLIDGLLDYSRVTTESHPFVPVDLAEVAGKVVADLEMRVRQTGGCVEIEELNGVVDADSLQMHQLFQNLIGNALKYHQADKEPVVKVFSSLGGAEEDDSHLCTIVVEDNGIGFDEKDRDSLFGIFKRLHRRTAYEGSGVGLATCKRIVERHGGSITAESAPGRGAKFIVTLPVKQVGRDVTVVAGVETVRHGAG